MSITSTMNFLVVFVTTFSTVYSLSCLKPSDPKTKLCCRFGETNRYNEDNKELQCCDETTFIMEEQICCGGAIFSKFGDDNVENQCCGSDLYIPKQKKQVCCDNTLHNLTSEGKDCCGISPINYNTYACCKDKTSGVTKKHIRESGKKCCSLEYYNKTTHYCFEKKSLVLPRNISMCGDVRYDVGKHKCCDGTLHNVTGFSDQNSCCKTSLYNNTEKKCCDEGHLIPPSAECCKTGHYFRSYQRCCNGNVLTMNKFTEACCGSSLYDKQYQDCCGGVTYNISTSTCCRPGGDIIKRGSNEQCCGPSKYDMDKEVCCNSQNRHEIFEVIKKETHEHNMCCTTQDQNHQSYSNDTHRCSVGKVIPREQMCENRKFNSSVDLCCNGVLFEEGKRKGRECCGIRDYSIGTQICCDTKIFPLTDKKRCNKKGKNVERKFLRNSKAMLRSKLGICKYCNYSKDGFDGGFRIARNFCNMKAHTVKITEKVLFEDKIILKGFIQMDMPSKKFISEKPVTLQVPCPCTVDTDTVVVLTYIQKVGDVMRLGDSDQILPWAKRIIRNLRKRRRTCQSRSKVSAKEILLNVRYFIDFFNHRIKSNRIL